MKVISNENDLDSDIVISRLASAVSKEESIEHLLKLVDQYNHAVPKNELVQIVINFGYPSSLIDQAIYYGLISQAVDVGSDDTLFCYITEMGLMVLEACENILNPVDT